MREGGTPWKADPKGGGSLLLLVKVMPGASKTGSAGTRETAEGIALLVRVAAAPEKGKANDELLGWLSRRLGVPQSALALRSGATARLKRIAIPAAAEAGLRALLDA